MDLNLFSGFLPYHTIALTVWLGTRRRRLAGLWLVLSKSLDPDHLRSFQFSLIDDGLDSRSYIVWEIFFGVGDLYFDTPRLVCDSRDLVFFEVRDSPGKAFPIGRLGLSVRKVPFFCTSFTTSYGR